MARPGTFVTGQVVTKAELDALGAVYTSGTRPTGADLYEGLHIWETDTDRWWVYDGTGWIIMAEPTVSYTPTLTNITLGTGTVSASYHRSDGWCDYSLRLTFGSSTSIAGGCTISLPVAYSTGDEWHTTQVLFYDSNVAQRYYGMTYANSTTTVGLVAINAGATYALGASVTNTVPFTWATGDLIVFTGRYRMATRYS